MNLTERVQTRKAIEYHSGTADVEGIVIDTAGFGGARFTFTAAEVASGGTNSMKVQQGDLANGGGMNDLIGTSITIEDDDDDEIFQTDIIKSLKRYLRLVLDKDTANVLAGSAVCDLYDPDNMAVAGSITDEITVETHISPIEGTA